MDTQRNGFDSDAARQVEAPGIEAPPVIGQDERRMHVRAYNFWAKLLQGRSFPSIESLDLDQLGDFGHHAILLDFTSGIDNPAIAHVGETLARECELDDSIQYISDIPRRSLLSRLTDHYLQIIANRAPIGFEAEFVNARGATILYRGVLLPFSSDDDTIDFILGVINWKQAAEPALSEAINEELAEAAAHAPATARPTLPVWGDGPDAGHAAIPAHDGREAALPTVEDYQDDELLLDAVSALDEMVDGPIEADGELGIADWLAGARACADTAAQANARGHSALYQALGRAWGFARAAESDPDGYAELLEEAGITSSPRAPMTPVVKLVFGIAHDKTRLAEYAAVLGYAAEEGLSPSVLPQHIASYQGGLKALVRTIRARKRNETARPDPLAEAAAALERAPVLGGVNLPDVPMGGTYMSLLVRREADGSLSIIGGADDAHGSTRQLMRDVARQHQG
jgi:hypothetical protein